MLDKQKIKNELYLIFFRLAKKSVVLFLKFPTLCFDLILKLINIANNKYIFLRATLLRTVCENVIKTMEMLSFKQNIIITPNDIFVESAGVKLSVEGTNRYFKVFNNENGNEGYPLVDFLRSKKLNDINCMVDLGANFGEISLFFAKTFPNAKIISVEASSANFKILSKNILNNKSFDTKNIIVENVAVSDKEGTIEISTGCGSENSIILDTRNPQYKSSTKTEIVKTNTLANILKKNRIKYVDFLKIDIEGAEPFLLESLKELGSNIKSIFMEMGSKNTYEHYEPIIEALYFVGFIVFTPDNKKLDTAQEAKDFLKEIKSKPLGSVDYWFIQKNLI